MVLSKANTIVSINNYSFEIKSIGQQITIGLYPKDGFVRTDKTSDIRLLAKELIKVADFVDANNANDER